MGNSNEVNVKILIVSNSEFSREYLTQLIESLGHRVYHSGGVGLTNVYKEIEKENIDVVLLDFQKDESILLDLAKKLKRTYRCIVMALMPFDSDLLEKSGKTGIDEVFLKPLDLHQLKVSIELSQQVKKFYDARVNLLKDQEELIIRGKLKMNGLIKEIEKQYERLEHLNRIVEGKEHKIKELSWKNENLIFEMINIIYRLSEYRDYETHEHTKRVGTLSRMMAEELELEDKFVEAIELAAPLHDIGKIGVPDSILLKRGKLSDEEFEEMKKHTIYGYELLKDSSTYILKLAAEIALTHHERWDGSGYPKGLKADEIPTSSQIVGVTDSFDAMVSERPYKRAKSLKEAFEEIERYNGTLYSPKVVEKFIKLKEKITDYYQKMGQAKWDMETKKLHKDSSSGEEYNTG